LKRYKNGAIGFAIIGTAAGRNRPRLFGVLKIENGLVGFNVSILLTEKPPLEVETQYKMSGVCG